MTKECWACDGTGGGRDEWRCHECAGTGKKRQSNYDPREDDAREDGE